MKKFIKLILALVLVFALCFSLSGCNVLSEPKEAHAIRIDEETIEYDGEEYKLLPNNEYFCPPFIESVSLNITESDVPVLLSEQFGDRGELNDDKTIIEYFDTSSFYCRKDKYQKVKKEVEAEFIKSGYCYSYTVFDEETYMSEFEYYTFSEKENDAIEKVLAYGEVVVLENCSYEYCANLEIYSRNLNFRKDFMQLCYSNGEFFLLDVDKDQQVMYKADSSLNQILSQAMKKADRYY